MTKPIDMVLHCPNCGMQHIDAPNHWSDRFDPPPTDGSMDDEERAEFDATVKAYEDEWTNPPHRSHLCHGCGHIWRPADVPTNGVAFINTKGNADSPLVSRMPQSIEYRDKLARSFGFTEYELSIAAGDTLDGFGSAHDITRNPGEPDESFRKRIQERKCS